MKNYFRFVAVAISAVAALTVEGVYAANQSPLDVVQAYLDYVASGNYESASELWTGSAQDRATRFGIEYTGIPVRVDAASPMVSHAENLTAYVIQPVQSLQNVGDDARYVKMLFTANQQGSLLQQWYYTKHEGEWYWLCYPQDALAHNWPVQESRYFRVHVQPGVASYVSAPALAQFDGFVEAVADTLGLTRTDIALIAAKKIDFFYCNDDSTVLEMTGQFTKGVLDLSSNDIISSSFPHHHEVVHLLTNIKLKTVPLYTLPVIREGLAVKFGGRWGKGPAALLDLGAFLHKDTLVSIDSMLTVSGFGNTSEMDLMYPVSGVLVSYFWDRLGKQKFWSLYRTLSATQDSVNLLRGPEVQSLLATAMGKKSWTDMRADFDAYLSRRAATSAVASAGTSDKGKILFATAENSVLLDGDWLSFTVKADSGTLPRASFLFFKDSTFGAQKSLLFDEHFMGSVPFEGYRYGVRVDQNEAGVYDYAGNIRTGKFILGINGIDHYYDVATNTVTIRFKKSLFGGTMPGPGDITAVPY
jgi:hypothetical protein